MRNLKRRLLPMLTVLLVLCTAMSVTAFAADDPTEESGTKLIECAACGAADQCAAERHQCDPQSPALLLRRFLRRCSGGLVCVICAVVAAVR